MTTPEYFSIGMVNTACAPDPGPAREQFAQQHALLARPGIERALVERFGQAAAALTFISDPVEDLGHRWIEKPHRLGAAIELALSRRPLLDWLEVVTGCGAISHIEGRVVETRPGGEDGLTWHTDTFDRALLGLTLHLADCTYEGGAFELREAENSVTTFVHDAAQAGDITVFDIDPRYHHRVLPVTGGTARRVFTGWFVSERI